MITLAGLTVPATFLRSEDRVFYPSITAADGTMSFARQDFASQVLPLPPIYAMQQILLLDRPLFAFSLPRADRPEGKLTVGGLDRNAYRGDLRYSSVESGPRFENLWALRGTINGHRGVMILDTGSSFIVLPMHLAAALFATLHLVTEQTERYSPLVAPALLAKYLCESSPIIQIRIGNVRADLHRTSARFYEDDDGWCTLSVIGAEQEDITLGRPFFENVYTAMDLTGRVAMGRI
ncbi:hypothetical protein V8E36_001927 [Tilletia maclaganii]